MKKNRIFIVITCLSLLAMILQGCAKKGGAKPAGEQGGETPTEAVATPAQPAQESNALTEAGTPILETDTDIAPDMSKEEKQKHIEEIMERAAATPEPNPLVAIARGTDYAGVTAEVIEKAGGLEGIIKEGDTVLIKPNICTLAEAGSGRITDYRAVQKVADMAYEMGAKRVIVAEGTISGNSFSKPFLQMNKYDTLTGVELYNLNDCTEDDCYELIPQDSVTKRALFIPKIYMDADVVINVAKLKTHFQYYAVVSLCLKNAIGVPSEKIYGGTGAKNGLHNIGLEECIIDINKIRKPDFCIIEGIVGGEGYGPLRNTPVDSQIMFAGKDPVAVDTVALNFMGFTVDKVSHVMLAGEKNLGISDLSQITVEGAVLDEIKMTFKR
jgi:uncharacterized protein (DUF362 family)